MEVASSLENSERGTHQTGGQGQLGPELGTESVERTGVCLRKALGSLHLEELKLSGKEF